MPRTRAAAPQALDLTAKARTDAAMTRCGAMHSSGFCPLTVFLSDLASAAGLCRRPLRRFSFRRQL
jgi:hypothetical protein